MSTQEYMECLNRSIFENDLILDKIVSYIDDETLPIVRLVSKKLFSKTLKSFRSRKCYNLQTFGSYRNLELQPVDHASMIELWTSEFLNFVKFPIQKFKIQWGIQSELFRLGEFDSDFYDTVLWIFKNIGPNLRSVHMETNVLKWDHLQRHCEIPLCGKVENVQLSMYNPKMRHQSLVPLFLIKFESMKSFTLNVPEIELFNNIIDTKDVYECLRLNMDDWYYLNELCISSNVPTNIFCNKMMGGFSQITKFKISPTNGIVHLTSFQEFLNSNASKIETLSLKIDTKYLHQIKWPVMRSLEGLAVYEVGQYDLTECSVNAALFKNGVSGTFPKLSKLILSVQVGAGEGQNVNYLRRTLLKFLPEGCSYKMKNVLQFHFSGFDKREAGILEVYKHFSKVAANVDTNVKNWFFNEIRLGRASDEDYYNYCLPGRYNI